MDDLHARDMPWPVRRAMRWHEQRTITPADVPAVDDLVARKRADGLSISVGVPALDEAETIGAICRAIIDGLGGSLVDEVVVLDGDSADDTVAQARAVGADTVDVRALVPDIPYAGGKGDSLWRSLARLRSDIVVWIDADIRDFDPSMVVRLVAPLLLDEDLVYVKGFYDRPIEIDGSLQPGGGRVTELTARPLLSVFFPELTGFRQPLAGEYAGRRDALMRVPFMTGYSVEVGLLIDLLGLADLDAMAQVDLTRRVHRNRPLGDLALMSHAIARTIMRRAARWGRLQFEQDLDDAHEEIERPPMADLERPPMADPERRSAAGGEG